MKFALGQAVPRTEDPRLLPRRGRYTDDFVLPRLAHACVLRSPHAHARIRSRAGPLCPGSSDLNLLGYGKSVIDLDAKIPRRTFEFFMPNTARRLPSG